MVRHPRTRPESGPRPCELGVVVPFKDESESLPLLVAELRPLLDELDCAYEVVLVDDGSSDGGWEILIRAQREWPELRLIRLTRNFGKEGAIRAGLVRSTAACVVVMDADLQHPPSLIPEMYQAWKASDAWVVEAVKRGDVPRGTLRRMGASIFYRLGEWTTGLPLRNRSDFQLLDRYVVDLFLALPERVAIFRGIIAWLGLPTVQIPFEVPPRAAGKTGWSFATLSGLALDMVTGFTNAPLRLMTYASLLFGTFAAVLGLQTFYMYATGRAVEGFTTVILVVLITGTALSIGLGIIGEYLARIYEEVKRRPQFVEWEVRGDAGEGEAKGA